MNATTFMYADDTIVYCIGISVNEVVVELNMALADLITWCSKQKSLIARPKKGEGMILKGKKFIGSLPSLVLNGIIITLDY